MPRNHWRRRKPLEPTVVADRLPARVENSGPKRVVKPNSLHYSTYGSEADLVAGDTAQARFGSTKQDSCRSEAAADAGPGAGSNGIITLLGDVGSEAERAAAAQDAARIGGIEALVNNLE